MKLIADRTICIGSGQCLTARENLTLGDDGKVMVLNGGTVTDDQLDDVLDATLVCPVDALRLVESDDAGSDG
jgi:ferredoxin